MPRFLLAGDGSEYRARLLDGGLFLTPSTKGTPTAHIYLETMCLSGGTFYLAQSGTFHAVATFFNLTVVRAGFCDKLSTGFEDLGSGTDANRSSIPQS